MRSETHVQLLKPICPDCGSEMQRIEPISSSLNYKNADKNKKSGNHYDVWHMYCERCDDLYEVTLSYCLMDNKERIWRDASMVRLPIKQYCNPLKSGSARLK